jgi:hypothetical protein
LGALESVRGVTIVIRYGNQVRCVMLLKVCLNGLTAKKTCSNLGLSAKQRHYASFLNCTPGRDEAVLDLYHEAEHTSAIGAIARQHLGRSARAREPSIIQDLLLPGR